MNNEESVRKFLFFLSTGVSFYLFDSYFCSNICHPTIVLYFYNLRGKVGGSIVHIGWPAK